MFLLYYCQHRLTILLRNVVKRVKNKINWIDCLFMGGNINFVKKMVSVYLFIDWIYNIYF